MMAVNRRKEVKMTKRQVKELSNDYLIYELSRLMLTGGDKELKGSIIDAVIICKELENRKVIKDAEYLFKMWKHRYML